jgi:monofunctional biosynthetic peptidoglycan transglycosylase
MKSPVKVFNELFKTNSEKSATRWVFSVIWMAAKTVAALIFQFIFVMGVILSTLNFVNPPVSSLMIYRMIQSKQFIHPVRWISLKKIPEDFQRMVVWLEDGRFYKHFGIDIKAIKEAIEVNREAGRNVVGASTIDQQLARTLFLVPTKSYIRKGIEAVIAIEMDYFIPKRRILELYTIR